MRGKEKKGAFELIAKVVAALPTHSQQRPFLLFFHFNFLLFSFVSWDSSQSERKRKKKKNWAVFFFSFSDWFTQQHSSSFFCCWLSFSSVSFYIDSIDFSYLFIFKFHFPHFPFGPFHWLPILSSPVDNLSSSYFSPPSLAGTKNPWTWKESKEIRDDLK